LLLRGQGKRDSVHRIANAIKKREVVVGSPRDKRKRTGDKNTDKGC